MLRAGLVGAGHLGKIHLKLLEQSEKYSLVGFHDADPHVGKAIEKELGYRILKISIPFSSKSTCWTLSPQLFTITTMH